MKHDWYYGSGEGLLAALWIAQPITVALLKPTYVPDLDTHKLWTDIAAQEITGTLYAQKALTSKATPYNAGTNRTDLQAADVSWGPGATFVTGFAALYDNSGTKPLWSLIDFEGTKSVDNGVFTIDFSAVGLLYLEPA